MGGQGRGRQGPAAAFSRQLLAEGSWESESGVRSGERGRTGVCVYGDLWTTKLFFTHLPNWFETCLPPLLRSLSVFFVRTVHQPLVISSN